MQIDQKRQSTSAASEIINTKNLRKSQVSQSQNSEVYMGVAYVKSSVDLYDIDPYREEISRQEAHLKQALADLYDENDKIASLKMVKESKKRLQRLRQ